MGKSTGFMEFDREQPACEIPQKRVGHYREFVSKADVKLLHQQAARCMDCGIPFCHNGCPLGNMIPEFNDAAYRQDWKKAIEILSSTNNFPEFTGRICPAPCESSCVLGINRPPVSIEFIEKSIVEKAFELGIVRPRPPEHRTGKNVCIIGSGPSGLACADQLNKAGHTVVVYERARAIGGLLRYGIPDFKLEKRIVQRRVDLLHEEGITFHTGVCVGEDILVNELEQKYDAIVLCIGSTIPRDLAIDGRNLKGIHFAMDFLSQQNSRNASDGNRSHLGKPIEPIDARGKHVVVIGGGDTGSDCVGTSNRQMAKSITQIEFLAKPPVHRTEDTPWPLWPATLRTSSSHEEGADRKWALLTKRFIRNSEGSIRALELVEVDWAKKMHANVPPSWQEVPASSFEIPCDLALLAIGFLHPQRKGLVEQFDLDIDQRGNIITNEDYSSSRGGIFAAGDARRGQSLVVWAISEGRECAYHVDSHLTGKPSSLARKDAGLLAQNI